jgi:hypothetical protein
MHLYALMLQLNAGLQDHHAALRAATVFQGQTLATKRRQSADYFLAAGRRGLKPAAVPGVS